MATGASHRVVIKSVAPLGLWVLVALTIGSWPVVGAAAKPEWLGSRAGIGDEVLPPWEPVAVSGTEVKVWGRS